MCECIKKVNEKFKEAGINTAIYVPATVSMKTGKMRSDRVTVATQKADSDKREKPKVLFAVYCPFCGERYGESDD